MGSPLERGFASRLVASSVVHYAILEKPLVVAVAGALSPVRTTFPGGWVAVLTGLHNLAGAS